MRSIVDASKSPHAALRPVAVSDVKLRDGFWAPRLKQNRRVIIPGQFKHLEETKRIENFRVASGKSRGTFEGIFFNDSDVYKWLEAAAWAVAADEGTLEDGSDPDDVRAIRESMEAAAKEVAAAQQPDGYLNTYFMGDRSNERWTNLKDMHELYCAGHFIQAAVAHKRATGTTVLLDVARKLSDHVGSVFGPGKRPGACGHPEAEMALVELARATGEKKHLDLAAFMVDSRGHGHLGGGEYHQDHQPFRDLDAVTGHAVRALYLNAGAADLALETGDAGIIASLERQWANMTTKRMYVTGGLGSRWEGEAFGRDYELPDDRAYAETCAGIAAVQWAWRMLLRTGDPKYADHLEWTLYNAVLPGLSLDGGSYFYQNPLMDDGHHRREPWFGCACCPPNVARTLAQLPGYFATTSRQGLHIHQYATGVIKAGVSGVGDVIVSVYGNYPWEDSIRFELEEGEGEFALGLRIPGWCAAGGTIEINGSPWQGDAKPGSAAAIRRKWKAGDSVIMKLPMPPTRITAHPHLVTHRDKTALSRGPVVYCLETCDHAGVDLRDLSLPAAAPVGDRYRLDLLGGVTALEAEAVVMPVHANWTGRLYRPSNGYGSVVTPRKVPVTAVPYFAWGNRAPGRMQVWTGRS